MKSVIQKFEQMLQSGRDSPLLRFSLGNEYLKADEPGRAADHLAQAVERDPGYSAAWKLYGKALTAAGRKTDAANAYARGIDVATQRGDKQAAKEMRVFLRRLNKSIDGD